MTDSVLRANFTVSSVTYQVHEVPPSNILVAFVEINSSSVPETIITSMRNHLGNLSAEAIITGFHPSCMYGIWYTILYVPLCVGGSKGKAGIQM